MDRVKMTKKGIENEQFISVRISFGINKTPEANRFIKETFDYFNNTRLKINKNNDGFFAGIIPKIVRDYFPISFPIRSSQGVAVGIATVPVQGYAKTKKFKLIKNVKGNTFKKSRKGFINQKTGDNIIVVGFVSTSKYSPIELAKDLRFLIGFNTLVCKTLKLPLFGFNNFQRKNNKIIVLEKKDIIEFEYPFQKRVELYKKNKELDKFIFKGDLKNYLNKKNSMFENDKLFEETKE